MQGASSACRDGAAADVADAAAAYAAAADGAAADAADAAAADGAADAPAGEEEKKPQVSEYAKWMDESAQKLRDEGKETAKEAVAAEEGGEEVVTYGMFKWYWTTEMEEYDASERFFRLIKQPGAEYIVRDDFLPYIQELLKDHPGLEFLSNHAEFQEKYAITVSK